MASKLNIVNDRQVGNQIFNSRNLSVPGCIRIRHIIIRNVVENSFDTKYSKSRKQAVSFRNRS